ncbi:LSU ribosomal protein L30P [Archaeoglobus sulfaticallidus PM70-1]|uniref:Large ribosomal subunit protein uL30 n=1 Tax=Archaeoglobus sulfaticallidus PM70-1 TaxID=387631 RepID=N0BAW9_9EURY|nr:50S ribosomal protein L30 [Archaeoglobus sulfaticallidus]AGK60143.1 LSU ribosomal protein L30P [Archaeoglobus sulfaticallidus PM70-1]
MKYYAVVRLRGRHDIRRSIRDTLKMLRLHKKYHCVIVPENETYIGMLRKVKDYVAYGEITAESLARLIRLRGRLAGNRRVTDEYIKEKTGYETIEDFAKAVMEGKVSLKDAEMKPVFRLHPPRGGLKNIKWHYPNGELGYQGENINKLLYKMR